MCIKLNLSKFSLFFSDQQLYYYRDSYKMLLLTANLTPVLYILLCLWFLFSDYFGMDVLANVCYLSQQPDPHQGGKLRWVMPVEYKDRCTCTIFRPGGWNMNPPLRSYNPYFIDQPLFIYRQHEIFKILDCSGEIALRQELQITTTYNNYYY